MHETIPSSPNRETINWKGLFLHCRKWFILIIVDGPDSCYPGQTFSYGVETWSGASVHSVADLLAPEQRGPERTVLQGRPVIRGADSRSVPWLIIQLGRHTFSRVPVRVDNLPGPHYITAWLVIYCLLHQTPSENLQTNL